MSVSMSSGPLASPRISLRSLMLSHPNNISSDKAGVHCYQPLHVCFPYAHVQHTGGQAPRNVVTKIKIWPYRFCNSALSILAWDPALPVLFGVFLWGFRSMPDNFPQSPANVDSQRNHEAKMNKVERGVKFGVYFSLFGCSEA